MFGPCEGAIVGLSRQPPVTTPPTPDCRAETGGTGLAEPVSSQRRDDKWLQAPELQLLTVLSSTQQATENYLLNG